MRRRGLAEGRPEFVPHDQWQARRRLVLRRRARFTAVVATFALVSATLAWGVLPYLRGQSLQAAATWLRTAPAVHITAINPATRQPMFEIWADRERSTIRRNVDGFRFVWANGRLASIGPGLAVWEDRDDRTADIREDLAGTIEAFAPWDRRSVISVLGPRTIDGQRADGFRLEDTGQRLTVWLDGKDNRPLECTRSVSLVSGWADLWTARIAPESAPASAYETASAETPEALRTRSLAMVANTEATAPLANDSVVIKSFEIGKTGIVYIAIELPKRATGRSRRGWQLHATDSLNGAYAESPVIRHLTATDERAPGLPETLSLAALVPQTPSTRFEPLTVTVTLNYNGRTGPPDEVSSTAEFSKHFEAPSEWLAPAYLYVGRSVDDVNRRVLTGQALSEVSYSALRINNISAQRSPNADLLNRAFEHGLDGVLATNAAFVNPSQLAMMLDQTMPTLARLQTDKYLDGADHAVGGDICEFLFKQYPVGLPMGPPVRAGSGPPNVERTFVARPRGGGRL